VVATGGLLARYLEEGQVPRCARCGGVLRPNVVLIGEQLPARELGAARAEAERCDLMLVAGSSLTVAPATALPFVARRRGADVIVVNREPTPVDDEAAVVLHADVARALPRIADLVLGEGAA
jgi:NAD-dependent deacetylase